MIVRNNADATRTNYVRGVRELMITLNRLLQDCDVDQLKALLVKLRDTGQLSNSSINIRVCGLIYIAHWFHDIQSVKIVHLIVRKPHKSSRYVYVFCLDMNNFILTSVSCKPKFDWYKKGQFVIRDVFAPNKSPPYA